MQHITFKIEITIFMLFLLNAIKSMEGVLDIRNSNIPSCSHCPLTACSTLEFKINNGTGLSINFLFTSQ